VFVRKGSLAWRDTANETTIAKTYVTDKALGAEKQNSPIFAN